MNRAVAVFGSSATKPGSAQWDEARRVGGRLARAGLTVVTGGYGGTMEAASQGAAEAGGNVIGVIAPRLFPDRDGANRHVDQVIEATSLGHRIEIMMQRSAATIALPGSIGTAAELIIAWNLNYIARNDAVQPVPTVAVGKTWREVGRVLIDMAGATPHDVQWADDGDEAVDWVLGRVEPA